MNQPQQGDFQRVVMAYGDDGLWDIVLGAILASIGVIEMVSLHPLWVTITVLAVPGVFLAKRVITAPRLRTYETRQTATARVRAAIWILFLVTLVLVGASVGLVVLTVWGWLSGWAAGILPIVLPILLALLGVIVMVTVGTMIDAAARYFFYAAVLAAGFLALLWPAVPNWLALVVIGGVMVAVGAGLLLRFLLSHSRTTTGQLTYRY